MNFFDKLSDEIHQSMFKNISVTKKETEMLRSFAINFIVIIFPFYMFCLTVLNFISNDLFLMMFEGNGFKVVSVALFFITISLFIYKLVSFHYKYRKLQNIFSFPKYYKEEEIELFLKNSEFLFNIFGQANFNDYNKLNFYKLLNASIHNPKENDEFINYMNRSHDMNIIISGEKINNMANGINSDEVKALFNQKLNEFNKFKNKYYLALSNINDSSYIYNKLTQSLNESYNKKDYNQAINLNNQIKEFLSESNQQMIKDYDMVLNTNNSIKDKKVEIQSEFESLEDKLKNDFNMENLKNIKNFTIKSVNEIEKIEF